MEIRLLKYFLAIAREQNISKAAIFLNTTQPNLSRQMQMLEDEIGKPLFIRNNKKMLLTETGQLLRKRAEEIVALCDQAEQELKAVDDAEVSGSVNIGAGESQIIDTICKTIQKVKQDYPKIMFNIYSDDTEEINYKLDSGLLDFGVVVEPYDLSKYNHLPLPGLDYWGILMHKDMPLAKKDKIFVTDLWHEPLLISRHSNSNNFITNWISKDESELNIVSTYNLIFNASRLVNSNVGYAITLENLINTTDTDLVFKRVEPQLTSKWHLAWKKYVILSKPVEIFLDYFMKEINE